MQRIIKAGLTAAVLAAAPVHAQQGQQHSQAAQREIARRVPVTVALVEKFPYTDASAVILRRPDATPRDIILLPRATATGDHLAAAVAQLLAIRAQAGDTATTAGTFRVRDGATPRGFVQRNARTGAGTIARLRTDVMRYVAGIGPAQATEVYLASRAMRAQRKASSGS